MGCPLAKAKQPHQDHKPRPHQAGPVAMGTRCTQGALELKFSGLGIRDDSWKTAACGRFARELTDQGVGNGA